VTLKCEFRMAIHFAYKSNDTLHYREIIVIKKRKEKRKKCRIVSRAFDLCHLKIKY